MDVTNYNDSTCLNLMDGAAYLCAAWENCTTSYGLCGFLFLCENGTEGCLGDSGPAVCICDFYNAVTERFTGLKDRQMDFITGKEQPKWISLAI